MSRRGPVALACALSVLVAVPACASGPDDAAGRPVLAARLDALPAAASVGQAVTVMLSIVNVGSVTVAEISSGLALGGTAKGVLVAVPEGGVRPSLAPGEEIATGWGIVASAPGSLEFEASVSASWVSAGRTATGTVRASAGAMVLVPPRLEVEWSGPPEGWCARVPFTVTLRVANAGEAAAAGVVPPVLDVTGPESGNTEARIIAAPPADPVVIPGGGGAAFTWTLTGACGGHLILAATVTGVDAGSGAPAAAWVRREVALIEPGRPAVAVSVPAEVSRGQWLTVVATVTNTGGCAITGLIPEFTGPPEGARLRRSPYLVGSRRPVDPGSGRRFRWSWSVTGLGELPFTVSVSCRTCDGAVEAAGTSSATVLSVMPAGLDASLGVSATSMVSGQKVTITLSLTNTGGAAAERLTALVPTPSTSRSGLVSGPLRAALDLLPGGSATSLSWVWTVSEAGPVGFTSRVSGRDANAGWGISTGALDAPPVRVLTPAELKIDRFVLFPGPNVVSGAFVSASLVITNKGETPGRLDKLEIKETKKPGGVFGPASILSPGLPCDLPAGDSKNVVWSYRTGVWGTATVMVTATTTEPATGRKIPVLRATSNKITVTAWTPAGGLY